MHIQWFTALVTETSCVIVNGFWAYWTPQKNIQNDKKKTNLNLLSSFKMSKLQESSTTYLSKHHTLITNSKTNSNRLNNTAVRNLLASMHVMRGLPLTIQPWLNPNYSPICILSYRIPRIIARGDYFFFRTLFSHHMTLTLDREGIKGKYLMSTCILFLLPFSTAFSKV